MTRDDTFQILERDCWLEGAERGVSAFQCFGRTLGGGQRPAISDKIKMSKSSRVDRDITQPADDPTSLPPVRFGAKWQTGEPSEI